MPPLNGLGIGTLLPVLKIITQECEKNLGLGCSLFGCEMQAKEPSGS